MQADRNPFGRAVRGFDLLLRLPPLYVMDTILINEMGISWVPSVLDDADAATKVG